MAMSDAGQKVTIKSGYVLVERPPNYEVVLTDQLERLSEISEFCKQADCRKVLIVGRHTIVKLSTMEVFRLGERIAKMNLQIAVVESHDATKTDVVFLEDVASNRGGPIQFFENEQDAKAWLGVE